MIGAFHAHRAVRDGGWGILVGLGVCKRRKACADHADNTKDIGNRVTNGRLPGVARSITRCGECRRVGQGARECTRNDCGVEVEDVDTHDVANASRDDEQDHHREQGPNRGLQVMEEGVARVYANRKGK